MYFDQYVSQFDIEADSAQEALQIGADKLHELGYVKDNFLEGLLKREEEFPTGLRLNGQCVAIPHTDSSYVNHSQIGFFQLKKPVRFQNMANREDELDVSMIFMLAMEKPHEQIDTLCKLMELFADEKTMHELALCHSQESYRQIIDNSIMGGATC